MGMMPSLMCMLTGIKKRSVYHIRGSSVWMGDFIMCRCTGMSTFLCSAQGRYSLRRTMSIMMMGSLIPRDVIILTMSSVRPVSHPTEEISLHVRSVSVRSVSATLCRGGDGAAV